MPASRAILLALLSGLPGLGYQVLWAKSLSIGLGREYQAVISSSLAFLLGMAIGCWVFSRLPPKRFQPHRLFASLELWSGLWMILLSLASTPLQSFLLSALGLTPSPAHHWSVTLLAPFLCMLPVSVSQGMSILLLTNATASSSTAPSACSAPRLYAANTFGAFLGVLVPIFLLLPQIGVRNTTLVLACINLIAAILAFRSVTAPPIAHSSNTVARLPSSNLDPSAPCRPCSPTRRWHLGLLGLLGVGYQLLILRALSQILENTIYSFAQLLAVYLVANALGAAWRSARTVANPDAQSHFHLLLTHLACCFIGMLALTASPSLYPQLRSLLGDQPLGVFLAETSLTTLTLAPAAFTMGALFSLLWSNYFHGSSNPNSLTLTAQAYGSNLLGAALAPAVISLILLPQLGLKSSLVLVSLSYLLLLPWPPRRSWIAFPVLLLATLAISQPLLPSSDSAPDKLIASTDGPSAHAAVIESPNGHRTLRVNRRFQMGGTGAVVPQRRQAHLPLLIHPDPHHALFLGMGTGITFAAASLHPNLYADSVELLHEVESLRPLFKPHNDWIASDRFRVFVCDARRFVGVVDKQYDVIVADLFHPALDGVGALYAREHFQAIRNRLRPDGLFCQWLPLHQMDLQTFNVITQTYLDVFPNAHAVLLRFAVDVPVVGLINKNVAPIDDASFQSRTQDPALLASLKQVGLSDPLRLNGCAFADTAQLRRWSHLAPKNTDDNQWVSLHAPRFSFLRDASTYGRFKLLLDSLISPPQPLAPNPSINDPPSVLSRFIHARNTYLQALMLESERNISAAMRGYVDSARLSPEFNLGYAQCLSLVPLLAQAQPSLAREILEALTVARPNQPIAADLLRRLKLDQPPKQREPEQRSLPSLQGETPRTNR